MASSKKRALGQFFTTNYERILEGMRIPDGMTKIIEPFAANTKIAPRLVAKLTIFAPTEAFKYFCPKTPTNNAIKKVPVPGPKAPS